MSVTPILQVVPLPTEHVAEQLKLATDRHAEIGFTRCLLILMRYDGDKQTTCMYYAPDQRVSEIISVIESAKFDLFYDAKRELNDN